MCLTLLTTHMIQKNGAPLTETLHVLHTSENTMFCACEVHDNAASNMHDARTSTSTTTTTTSTTTTTTTTTLSTTTTTTIPPAAAAAATATAIATATATATTAADAAGCS